MGGDQNHDQGAVAPAHKPVSRLNSFKKRVFGDHGSKKDRTTSESGDQHQAPKSSNKDLPNGNTKKAPSSALELEEPTGRGSGISIIIPTPNKAGIGSSGSGGGAGGGSGVVHRTMNGAPGTSLGSASGARPTPTPTPTPTVQVVAAEVNPVPKPNPSGSNKTTASSKSGVPSSLSLSPSPTPSPSPSSQMLSPDRMGPSSPRSRSASRVWLDFLIEPGLDVKAGGPQSESVTDASASETEYDSDYARSGTHGRAERGSINSQVTEASDLGGGRRKSKKPKEPKVKNSEQEADERKTWFNKTTGEQVSSRHVDDLIFETFATTDENGKETILVGAFLSALEKTGLRNNDSRLATLFAKLRRIHRDVEIRFPKMVHSIEILNLDRETFKDLITDDILLISKAFRQQFVIPDFQRFCLHIEEIYSKCKVIRSGQPAAYIPQLARADPNWWGVSLCTIDGQRFSIGDTRIPFTIQSCSKSLTYGICLDELGESLFHDYIGQEPSGRMFNEIVLDHRRKPHNPMINAGAIVTCSLLKQLVHPEMSLAEKFDFTYNYFKKLAGGEYIGFDNATFLSEREVADRNFALGFYMRENKCFPEGTKLKECLDFYFQVCSLECNCESAAVIAATLANGGICPVSEEKILKPDSVRNVLALMHSCGMYDYSGQFAFKVGLPAKSGVSGIVMVIVPNVLGMAVWSPPLDHYGNSVRGVAFCQELVQIFNFHKYDELKNVSHKLDPRKRNFETKGLNIVNLLFSAALGDIDSIRRHHLSGMDMNVGDYDGRTALHLAAAEGHLECVNYLIHHCQLNHNPVDAWGHLPVDDARRSGHDEIVRVLENWMPRAAQRSIKS